MRHRIRCQAAQTRPEPDCETIPLPAGSATPLQAVCPTFTFTKSVTKSYSEMHDTTNAISASLGFKLGWEQVVKTNIIAVETETKFTVEGTAEVSYTREWTDSYGSSNDTTDERQVTYPSQASVQELNKAASW
jgi:hypothetical protein